MTTPQEGQEALDFALKGGKGETHRLSGYAGKKAILCFCPKDDTPGCTTQACGFRDHLGDFGEKGNIFKKFYKVNPEAHWEMLLSQL